MSDTNFGKQCLVHFNHQHIQVRKDFLDLCAYDKSQYNQGQRKSGKARRDEPNQECMAKILRLLETLTDLKKSQWQSRNETLIAKKHNPQPEPREYRIELAYSIIVRLLYNTYGESTVRNSIAALLQMNYIKRYQKTKNSIPEYVLNIPVLQQALNNQYKTMQDDEVLISTPEEEGVFLGQSEVLHSTAEVLISTPEVLHSTAQGVNSTPNKKENNKTHNIDDKKEREESQRDQPPTKKPSLSSSQKNNALLSEQEETIIVHWEEIIECAAPHTEKVKAAAKELARCNATKEDIIAVRDFCLRTNPEWYEKTGIDLATIVRNWSKWKSTIKRTAEKNKTLGGYTIYQPDPGQKDLPFVGTERQRKERKEEQKNIPTELKHIYDKVAQCSQELGGSVQDAHEDALETIKFYRERGVSISKQEFDERVDVIMEQAKEQLKEQNEPDYVAQNILSTSVFKLALDKSKAKA